MVNSRSSVNNSDFLGGSVMITSTIQDVTGDRCSTSRPNSCNYTKPTDSSPGRGHRKKADCKSCHAEPGRTLATAECLSGGHEPLHVTLYGVTKRVTDVTKRVTDR